MKPATQMIWLRDKKSTLLKVSVLGAAVLLLLMLFFICFHYQMEKLISDHPRLSVSEAAVPIERYVFVMIGSILVMAAGFLFLLTCRQNKFKQQIESRNRELKKLFTAVRQSPVSIVITDLEGRIEYANDATCRMTGYPCEELRGMKPNALKYGTTPPEEYKKLWTTISGGKEWRGTFLNERKDGMPYWEAVSVTPIFNSDNQITNYLVIKEDITEKKEAQDERLKFKAVSDQMSYGVAVTDLYGNIEYINDAFANMHRWPKQELLGQNVSVLQTPEAMKSLEERLERIRTEGGLRAHEMERQTKDGTVFPALMTEALVFDSFGNPEYISVTVIDITDIKERDAELNIFNIAMTQSTVAFVITDLEANIIYVNPAFSSITGYRSDEILGKNARLMSAGQTPREVYDDLWMTIRSGGTWKGQWLNKKKTGETYMEKVSITPIYENKKIVNYLAVKEDISELIRAEENRFAREVAERANQSKTMFLSNMSHEIRTPLNAIIGFAQILKRDEALSQKQAQQVTTILRSSEHLLKIINNILDIAKIESGKISVSSHDFCLRDLLDDLQMMFSIQAQSRELRFEISVQDNVPKKIFSDDAKIRQILINLIGNAMKFTVRGEVALKVTAKPTEEENKLLLEFAVRDTGPGIEAGELGTIFDSFTQTQLGAAAGGTGLGLSICKHFAELMGGRVSVESRIGEGSIFRVIIPVGGAVETLLEPVKTYENLRGVKSGEAPYRILIADDQEYNRQMLIDVLGPIGFALKEAVNGQEALDLFEQWNPHVILMDIKMPVMDGYEAIRRIKETAQGKETLVIAVTASAFDKDIDRVMASGTDYFLSKPFRLEELYTMLESVKGLEYEFSEAAEAAIAESMPEMTAEEIRETIPPEILLKMYTAVRGGDIAGLRECIREIGGISGKTSNYLSSLVRDYNYDRLIEILVREEELLHE